MRDLQYLFSCRRRLSPAATVAELRLKAFVAAS